MTNVYGGRSTGTISIMHTAQVSATSCAMPFAIRDVRLVAERGETLKPYNGLDCTGENQSGNVARALARKEHIIHRVLRCV